MVSFWSKHSALVAFYCLVIASRGFRTIFLIAIPFSYTGLLAMNRPSIIKTHLHYRLVTFGNVWEYSGSSFQRFRRRIPSLLAQAPSQSHCPIVLPQGNGAVRGRRCNQEHLKRGLWETGTLSSRCQLLDLTGNYLSKPFNERRLSCSSWPHQHRSWTPSCWSSSVIIRSRRRRDIHRHHTAGDERLHFAEAVDS